MRNWLKAVAVSLAAFCGLYLLVKVALPVLLVLFVIVAMAYAVNEVKESLDAKSVK